MSERLLVEEAKRRAEVFRNLEERLRVIAEVVREMDRDARVYLFGSVAEGRHLLSSDIDVLVVTRRSPGEVLARLWEKGIGDPFEVHVVTEEMLELYRRRARLVEIA
ncbi:nucleotidyltransferase domain-containing protein [Infirmifilum sp. NZ]|uniref:nucleotidyltransferase domain-containing protein n=1 Tax=Infirmifilum sp. NZ TaxID=2926850 RepID=UPI00279B1D13|nr:nucleotidyltransferase domain-containing protein [Infirmifilum sp. NZ]UNQ73176.1 nucleotidyltransferase domain-containing protein [Infirmifilum sp. NZ]